MVNTPGLPNLPNAASSNPPSSPNANAGGSPRQARYSFEISGSRATDSRSPGSRSVDPFPTSGLSHLPLLPRRKRPILTSHRHDANPALALKVLQDLYQAVEGWHRELRETLDAIQALYLEGPIVEGWLEAVTQPGSPAKPLDASVLRHEDPQQLAAYIDQICHQSSAKTAADVAQYRLCTLDADGRMQCQPCPTDQLSIVSMAIARHQKLRQHLGQKQYLEAKLKRAVEVLTGARETLDITPQPEG